MLVTTLGVITAHLYAAEIVELHVGRRVTRPVKLRVPIVVMLHAVLVVSRPVILLVMQPALIVVWPVMRRVGQRAHSVAILLVLGIALMERLWVVRVVTQNAQLIVTLRVGWNAALIVTRLAQILVIQPARIIVVTLVQVLVVLGVQYRVTPTVVRLRVRRCVPLIVMLLVYPHVLIRVMPAVSLVVQTHLDMDRMQEMWNDFSFTKV